MSSFLRRHARQIWDDLIRIWYVFVVVFPLFAFGLYLAVDHANANAARQQRHSNQQAALQQRRLNQRFQQAQILANHKFQQGIRISIAQSTYSTNKSVCGWRGFLVPTLTDKRIPQTRRHQIAVFLESQVTVPSDFNCASLPRNPPKAHP